MALHQLKSEVTGSVWKIEVAVGAQLDAGAIVMYLESMKMEIPLIAEDGGTLVELRVEEGVAVVEGQVLAVLRL